MDTATKNMLADLGLAKRSAIVNSISARDFQDASQRSIKRSRVRIDPHMESTLKKWKTFHVRDEAQPAYIATGPPITPQIPQIPQINPPTVDMAPRSTPSATLTHAAKIEPVNTEVPSAKPGSLTFKISETGGKTEEGEIKFRLPIEASIIVNSRSGYVGVLELASLMERLAVGMQTKSYRVMSGVYDDGTGLFDVDDLSTDLELAGRAQHAIVG